MLIVLNTEAQLKAFKSDLEFKLDGDMQLTVGPVGRDAQVWTAPCPSHSIPPPVPPDISIIHRQICTATRTSTGLFSADLPCVSRPSCELSRCQAPVCAHGLCSCSRQPQNCLVRLAQSDPGRRPICARQRSGRASGWPAKNGGMIGVSAACACLSYTARARACPQYWCRLWRDKRFPESSRCPCAMWKEASSYVSPVRRAIHPRPAVSSAASRARACDCLRLRRSSGTTMPFCTKAPFASPGHRAGGQ